MTPAPKPRPPTPLSRASVRAWLVAREPSPPAVLATRLSQCVDSAPDEIFACGDLATVVGALGTWLLKTALGHHEAASDAAPDAGRPAHDSSDAPPAGSRPGSRAAALDLLAADALVTYAFEAAAGEGTDVTPLADGLLAQISA